MRLSEDTMKDAEGFVKWMSELLRSHPLKQQELVFEIHEKIASAHLKDAKVFFAGLKELHCGFAIEHFGVNEHAFNLVKHLPADYLKIDGSLMHKLAQNPEQQERVKNIATTAHDLGKLTIAEFVEDASSLSVLWQCGVKFIQGNFLQEPHPLMDYEFSEEATV